MHLLPVLFIIMIIGNINIYMSYHVYLFYKLVS